MKKILLSTLLFLATANLQAQFNHQVGKETLTNQFLIHSGAQRVFTQTLYPENLLPPVMNILEIAYEYVGTNAGPVTMKIWMSTTDEENVHNRFLTAEQENNKLLVFDGVINLTPPASGQSAWITLVLENPYVYKGGNLVVTTSTIKEDYGGNFNFRVSPDLNATHVTVWWWDDTPVGGTILEDPLVFLPHPTTGVMRNPRASWSNYLNIRFTYANIDARIFSMSPSILEFEEQLIKTTETKNLTISNGRVTPGSAEFATITVTGVEFSNPAFSTTATFPVVLNADGTNAHQIPISFTPNERGDYSSTATFTILEDDFFGSTTLTINAKARDFVPSETICWGNPVTTGPGPHGSIRYLAMQYIMSTEDIGTDVEGRIRRIGWDAVSPCTQPNRIAVYLKNVPNIRFPRTGTTWMCASEMTKVYEGPFMFNDVGWNYLDIEPWVYDGTSNIMIMTVQLESPASNISSFRSAQRANEPGRPNWTSWFDLLLVQSTSRPVDPYNVTWPATTPYSSQGSTVVPITCFIFEEISQEPFIFPHTDFIDFEEQEMVMVNKFPLRVVNFGKDDLIITGVSFTSEDFYVTDVTFPITIPFEGEHIINFVATPLQLGLKTGQATFEFATPTIGDPRINLSVFGLRYLALREGFEKEMFPPVGWRVIDANNDGASWRRYKWLDQPGTWHFIPRPHKGHGIVSPDQNAGDAGSTRVFDDWLITPKMRYGEGDKFSFYMAGGLRYNDVHHTLYLKLSRTGNNPEDFTQTIEMLRPLEWTSYTKFEYDLGELGLKDGDEFYIGFHEFSFWTSRYTQIDEFRGPAKVMPNHDILVQEFATNVTRQGATISRVGTMQTYSAIIANGGINTVTPSDFTVELCYFDENNNVVVLASMPGQTMAREDYYRATFNYAFTEAGKFRTFIRVVFAQDENLSNNSSNTIMVDILPETVDFITSGTMPVDHNDMFKYMMPVWFQVSGLMGSVCQTFHPKEHFTGAGIIERYALYIDHPISRPNRHYKIWMSNTTMTNFGSTGARYPNANEMELVFDGLMTFPQANAPYEMFEIQLQNPFFYTGEGLIVMIEYIGGIGVDGGPFMRSVVNTNQNRTL